MKTFGDVSWAYIISNVFRLFTVFDMVARRCAPLVTCPAPYHSVPFYSVLLHLIFLASHFIRYNPILILSQFTFLQFHHLPCYSLLFHVFPLFYSTIKGPTKHLRSMVARDRLPFSLAYVGSMVGTLYACLVLKSYIWVVAFSAVQMVALAWYFLSFVPGGSQGMK